MFHLQNALRHNIMKHKKITTINCRDCCWDYDYYCNREPPAKPWESTDVASNGRSTEKPMSTKATTSKQGTVSFEPRLELLKIFIFVYFALILTRMRILIRNSGQFRNLK